MRKESLRFPPSRPRLAGQPKGAGWRSRFDQVIRENYTHKYLPGLAGLKRRTSFRTQEFFLSTCFFLLKVLRFDLGMKVEKPKNVDARHARAIANWINGQKGKLGAATLAGYATAWRALMRWCDQPGLVEVFNRDLDPIATARVLAAQHDKSWDSVRDEVDALIERACTIELWVALCLVAQDAFGLRRREAVRLRPLVDFDLKACVLKLEVGPKGARYREVPIDSAEQVEVAKTLMHFVWNRAQSSGQVADMASLAPASLQLKQALDRYSNVVRDLGLTRKIIGATGHGGRAGYACRKLQALGVLAVVKGGDGRHPEGRAADIRAHLTVSNAMGHSRKGVIGAYAGAASGVDRVSATATLRAAGLLLEGQDAASHHENTRRINAYLRNQREFLAEADAAQRSQEGGNSS